MTQAPAASAAQAYPERPVRIIVPFGAGGANDVVARIVATRLTDVLGQQVVVDNRTGAGGLIGTEIAAKATPDGYTLLGTATPHVIFPHLHKKMPYDTLKDFAPIMQIGGQPYAITVHPSLGVGSIQELIALARKQPGAINYASSGNGGAQHMFAALLFHMAKINLVHVPYKDSGLAARRPARRPGQARLPRHRERHQPAQGGAVAHHRRHERETLARAAGRRRRSPRACRATTRRYGAGCSRRAARRLRSSTASTATRRSCSRRKTFRTPSSASARTS